MSERASLRRTTTRRDVGATDRRHVTHFRPSAESINIKVVNIDRHIIKYMYLMISERGLRGLSLLELKRWDIPHHVVPKIDWDPRGF